MRPHSTPIGVEVATFSGSPTAKGYPIPLVQAFPFRINSRERFTAAAIGKGANDHDLV